MFIQNLVNHFTMIMDRSISMKEHKLAPIAFDREIEAIKTMSVEMNQETRVSIYLFGDEVKLKCLAFDMDVMRFKSMAELWKPTDGSTAIRSAVSQAITDAQKIPEIYGDHAHVVKLFTDGEENSSYNTSPGALKARIQALPDNWTVTALVPHGGSATERLVECGFLRDNITTWDTHNAKGSEVAADTLRTATRSFMAARATGARSTKSFFSMDTSALTKTVVRRAMAQMSPALYEILPTRRVKPKTMIKDFVESWTKQPYRIGSAYHVPEVPIEIQNHKNILIQDKKTGWVYEGAHVRGVLGLPDYTVKVAPADHPDYNVFVQSTSVNRHVKPESFVLVMK